MKLNIVRAKHEFSDVSLPSVKLQKEEKRKKKTKDNSSNIREDKVKGIEKERQDRKITSSQAWAGRRR